MVHVNCLLEIHSLISLKNAEITGKIQMVASFSFRKCSETANVIEGLSVLTKAFRTQGMRV